jgi:M6 family metalloprotease-like protein
MLLFLIWLAPPNFAAVTGDRPLLVILVEYRDQRFDDPNYLSNFKSRIFGPAEPNVTEYYRETSHGRFTYVAAISGERSGSADGMVYVLMDVLEANHPSGPEYRRQVLALADPLFNYSRYDSNGDGTIQDSELAVLVIHATNEGTAGKTDRAGIVALDGVSLSGLGVAVVSDNAPNYTLFHELGHLVDLGGYAVDLYNQRDGIQQQLVMWEVGANGAITRRASRTSEIALEVDATGYGTGYAVAAYRDQNGELSLANYDISSANSPSHQKIARAGLASDISVAQLSALRAVTALRSGSGSLKLIVWDVDFGWNFIRRGDYTAGSASDIEVAALSSSRVVAGMRDSDGNFKLICFDVSQDGELTRRGNYTSGGATEINVVMINSSRIVAAMRQAGGNLKVICFDVSAAGNFTRRGDWEAGIARDIDLARVSSRRVATSVRTEAGNLKVILFGISDQGDVTRQGSFESDPVCDKNTRCTGDAGDLPQATDLTAKTSIASLTTSRLAVAFVDPAKLLQMRTLDIVNDDLILVGSASTPDVPNQLFVSGRIMRSSSSLFATVGQIDGQIWTGNGYGLLGGWTGNNLVHFDPYTKLKLGWLPYTEISSSTPFGLAPMGHGAAQALIVRVPGHRQSEYFILEVRNRESLYERGLPDEGLAIWHIDELRPYPQAFASLEWLGGSAAKALWAVGDSLVLYDDSSSPSGSRWNDFSTSGLSIRQIDGFFGGLSFEVDIR